MVGYSASFQRILGKVLLRDTSKMLENDSSSQQPNSFFFLGVRASHLSSSGQRFAKRSNVKCSHARRNCIRERQGQHLRWCHEITTERERNQLMIDKRCGVRERGVRKANNVHSSFVSIPRKPPPPTNTRKKTRRF